MYPEKIPNFWQNMNVFLPEQKQAKGKKLGNLRNDP
jgi:hypothetical protein